MAAGPSIVEIDERPRNCHSLAGPSAPAALRADLWSALSGDAP